MSEQAATPTIGAALPRRSVAVLVSRGMQHPGQGFRYAVALLKGYWYRAVLRMLGRRFRAGSRFRVFGRLSVRGSGEVIFGDNVVIWGRVNTWTYAPDAQLIAGDDVMMSGTRFACAHRINIGRGSILADASIYDTDFHSTRADRRSPDAPIRIARVQIGENVWVGAGAILLPGTTIGQNSVVGAGAVCMRSYPADRIILGNPAKVAMPIPSIGAPVPAFEGEVTFDEAAAAALAKGPLAPVQRTGQAM